MRRREILTIRAAEDAQPLRGARPRAHGDRGRGEGRVLPPRQALPPGRAPRRVARRPARRARGRLHQPRRGVRGAARPRRRGDYEQRLGRTPGGRGAGRARVRRGAKGPPLPTSRPRPSAAEEALRRAAKLYEAEKYWDAIQLLEPAIEPLPRSCGRAPACSSPAAAAHRVGRHPRERKRGQADSVDSNDNHDTMIIRRRRPAITSTSAVSMTRCEPGRRVDRGLPRPAPVPVRIHLRRAYRRSGLRPPGQFHYDDIEDLVEATQLDGQESARAATAAARSTRSTPTARARRRHHHPVGRPGLRVPGLRHRPRRLRQHRAGDADRQHLPGLLRRHQLVGHRLRASVTVLQQRTGHTGWSLGCPSRVTTRPGTLEGVSSRPARRWCDQRGRNASIPAGGPSASGSPPRLPRHPGSIHPQRHHLYLTLSTDTGPRRIAGGARTAAVARLRHAGQDVQRLRLPPWA